MCSDGVQLHCVLWSEALVWAHFTGCSYRGGCGFFQKLTVFSLELLCLLPRCVQLLWPLQRMAVVSRNKGVSRNVCMCDVELHCVLCGEALVWAYFAGCSHQGGCCLFPKIFSSQILLLTTTALTTSTHSSRLSAASQCALVAVALFLSLSLRRCSTASLA